MNIDIAKSTSEMACHAAKFTADIVRKAIVERGEARIILATGASQFDFIKNLTAEPDIDWSRVTCFHLDEYIGLPVDHIASFRNYMRKRFVAALPMPPKVFNEVNGNAEDLDAERLRLSKLLNAAPIDVACVGIGENGHLAFNDPPADFETEDAYLVVDLDHKCRMQQVGEGWFKTIDDVPKQAFSMSIRQIMKSRVIVCTVPDARKAEAVKGAIKGPVTNLCPSSILQTHRDCGMFLDPMSASLL